jgi:hypothetical protein
MEEEIILPPYKYAQFETIEDYAAQNQRIVDFKNQQTSGEFERTDTEYYYTPDPEPAWNGLFYMEAKPEFQEAGLFDDCTLLDEIPVEVTEPETL